MAVMEEENRLPNGNARRYHPNGQLAYEGQYVAGEREGVFHYFNDDGQWEKQEFFRRGRLVWTSSQRDERFAGAVFETPKRTPRPLFLRQDIDTPLFLGMRPAVLRNGVSLRGTHQEVVDNERTSRAHLMTLDMSKSLDTFGLECMSAYGALGQALVQLGTPGGETDVGRRMLELGARWHAPRARSSLSLGVALPMGGDTLENYRAERAGRQLGMDTLIGYPRSMGLRTHGTHTRRHGALWLRGDTGLDVVVNTHGSEELELTDPAAAIVRIGAAAGVATARFFASGHLRALHSLSGGDTRANASLSLSIRQYTLQPGVVVYLPLIGAQSKPGAALSLTYVLN